MKQIVGEDFDIGADRTEDRGDDHAFDGAVGMIGDDDDGAGLGDLGQVFLSGAPTGAEDVESSVDEIAFFVAVLVFGLRLAVDGIELGKSEHVFEG